MRYCTECGGPFREAPGWAPGLCGQCLADKIEASLMLQLLGPRKPAKRAEDSPQEKQPQQAKRRSA